jgi:hypothetical protein
VRRYLPALLLLACPSVFAGLVEYSYESGQLQDLFPIEPAPAELGFLQDATTLKASFVFDDAYFSPVGTQDLSYCTFLESCMGLPDGLVSWSISDGISSLDQDSNFKELVVSISFDAQGDISAWFFHVWTNYIASPTLEETMLPGEAYYIHSAKNSALNPIFNTSEYCWSVDQDGYCDAFEQVEDGWSTASTWSVNTVIPVPAAVWLFASGLGLLGFFKRRH